MARQLSFSKYEQELRPELRQNLNIAESTEDVKKFFVYTIQKLFGRVLEGKEAFTYEDIRLDPQEQSGFIISEKLLGDPDFATVWSNSDLYNIVKRIADAAGNRAGARSVHPVGRRLEGTTLEQSRPFLWGGSRSHAANTCRERAAEKSNAARSARLRCGRGRRPARRGPAADRGERRALPSAVVAPRASGSSA